MLLATTMPAGLCAGAPAFAQDIPPAAEQVPAPTLTPAPTLVGPAPALVVPAPSSTDATPAAQQQVAFEADKLEYQQDSQFVTASGNVVLRRGDQSVRSDQITWNRQTGQIVATGNVRAVDQDGNQLFSDRIELTDEFRAGVMENLLIVLREGGRLAADRSARDNQDRVRLTNAAYTGCTVRNADGCPRNPTWRITAHTVVYDQQRKRLSFDGARLWLFGMSLMPLPGLSASSDGSAGSGLMIPELRFSRSNGVEINETYYWRLAPNQDLALTGYIYSGALPMVSAKYRQLNDLGAFQVTGYATRSQRTTVIGTPESEDRFRGYLDFNGRLQLSPNWSITASSRVVSDRTFLRRYDISRDDRLRSMFDVERITSRSYLSIAGWAVQTLRVGDVQRQQPIALPLVDYRNHLKEPLLAGTVTIQLNTLALTRIEGQDTQRAFASAQWDLRKITPWGQEVTFTALVRGDVYHSDENDLTATELYRGMPGWQARGVATAAVDVRWPFVGPALGGTQVFAPRVQLVATPKTRNLSIPNEDARAIELEDSNLFALNRFPGYDRIEDGVRVTYGFDWQLERPGWRVKTTIGQSYRLTNRQTLIPDGTGIYDRLSDIVGRTEVQFRDFISVVQSFRLDKDTFAIRRNEVDATVGSRKTYVQVGYLRLNRNITSGIEDLQDREELQFAARVAFAKYWAVFGSGVINLTNEKEDPTLDSDGFQPIRTRFGVVYRDDCFELGLTWRRDFITTGDAKKGNSLMLHVALRNLGLQ